MNRLLIAILLLFPLVFISSEMVAQCIANAGNDTVFCNQQNGLISLGGNPTASGGSGNYYYTWSCSSGGLDPYFSHASNFLSDTTAANPVLVNVPSGERRTVNFKLLVVDDAGNQCKDSVNVTTVAPTCVMIQCYVEINAGDTVNLSPYSCSCANDTFITFHWTGNNLSDILAEYPFATPTEYLNYYNCVATDDVGCFITDECTIVVHPLEVDDLENNFLSTTVFPDPIDDLSVLQWKNSSLQNLNIEIFNFLGKKIFETTSSGNSIGIGNLIHETGEYFYRISIKGKTMSSGRFTKN